MDHKYIQNRSRKPVFDYDWCEEDSALALDLLKTDPLYHRLAKNTADELTSIALNTGAANAEELIDICGCSEPLKISKMMKVRVLFDISYSSKPGAINILSQYTPKPPTITVFENRLRMFRERLPKKDKVGRTFLSNLTNICVAHELYHHIERQTFCYINLSYKVPIVDLKLIKIEKSLTMLSEIAAHSFAMRLMGLPRLPCIIFDEFPGKEWERNPHSV